MTERYMLCVGSLKPISIIGKHKRAVINRCIAEPDTIAIVKANQPTVYYLYRVDHTGRSERIGWITSNATAVNWTLWENGNTPNNCKEFIPKEVEE